MGIDSGFVGQSEINDMGEIVDVKTAGSHIRRNENRCHPVAEFLHDDVALLLRQVAVEGVGVISVGDEPVGDFLSVAACATEHDGVDIGRVVGDSLEP